MCSFENLVFTFTDYGAQCCGDTAWTSICMHGGQREHTTWGPFNPYTWWEGLIITGIYSLCGRFEFTFKWLAGLTPFCFRLLHCTYIVTNLAQTYGLRVFLFVFSARAPVCSNTESAARKQSWPGHSWRPQLAVSYSVRPAHTGWSEQPCWDWSCNAIRLLGIT